MAKYSQIIPASQKILSDPAYKGQPLTLRQLYYRLVAANIIKNKRSSYNSLSRIMVKARELGEIDDTKIIDNARQVHVYNQPVGVQPLGAVGFVNTLKPEEYHNHAIDLWKELESSYCYDYWRDQDEFIECWVEKDALAGVVMAMAHQYRVTVCPSRGYASYTYLKRQAVDGRFADVKKDIVILDFRDHDPSGIQMTSDVQTRFTRYGMDKNIVVDRIALTYEQVQKHKLVPNPTKRLEGDPSKFADPRAAFYVHRYGDRCWELDALPPDVLQALIKKAIEEHINKSAWKRSVDLETKYKKELKKLFEDDF